MQGIKAVEAVLEMTPDTPSPVVTIREDKITLSVLSTTVAVTKKANLSMQAKDFHMAMQLRDPEFLEYHKAYRHLNAADYRKMMAPQDKVCIWTFHTSIGLLIHLSAANARCDHSRWIAFRRHEPSYTCCRSILLSERSYSNCNSQRLPRSLPSSQRYPDRVGP